MVWIGAPTLYVGFSSFGVGEPTLYVGIPMVGVGAPTLDLGVPMQIVLPTNGPGT